MPTSPIALKNSLPEPVSYPGRRESSAHQASRHCGLFNSGLAHRATETGNYGLQLRQIWIQLITACRNTAREIAPNMHHWSGWTETVTENIVDQAGSRHHCSSHSSMATSIAADQWCMCCIPLLQYFPYTIVNWIQIWRIWRPQLRWDKFWSFSI